MKVIAAYLLARLGKFFPDKEDVKAILASVGAEADDDKIDYLLKQVRGKNVELLIDVGREMMASTAPAAAGGGAAFTAAPAGGAGGGAAPAAEEKKEEKKEEKQESDDEEDTLFNLFE